MKIVSTSNPAALGARWTEDTIEYELAVPRGTESVWFGSKGESGKWNTTPVTNPERFGPTPTNDREMRAFASAFIGGGL